MVTELLGKRVYTLVQAARLLGISRNQMLNHARLGNIPFAVVGHSRQKIHRKFFAEDLDDFLIKRLQGTKAGNGSKAKAKPKKKAKRK